MAGKKRATKKRATKKKVTPQRIVRDNKRPAGVEDYLCPETGELLNPKHEMFCQAWVQTFDNGQALTAAGFKWKTSKQSSDQSRQLLRQAQIQHRVRAILRERVTDFALTEEWVLLEMLDLIRLGKKEVPIIMGKGDDAQIVGYDHVDLRTASMNVAKIGEAIGMFQKKDNEKPTKFVFNLNYGGPPEDEPKQVTHEAIEGTSRRLQ